ncbi:hypothetical protein CDAR_582611 [Caerostris darwini]|uniref:Uncharacterized protein n=1 Tax=Caerostris darwini TaxID=1538125 RepID=A0AAV4PPQ1_9ARAC|nr:hypothetical protein CDAR_582611 [Caerostris darwini]
MQFYMRSITTGRCSIDLASKLKKKRDKERKTGRKSRCERSAPAMRAPLTLRGGLFIAWETPDSAVASGRGSSHLRMRPRVSPMCAPVPGRAKL